MSIELTDGIFEYAISRGYIEDCGVDEDECISRYVIHPRMVINSAVLETIVNYFVQNGYTVRQEDNVSRNKLIIAEKKTYKQPEKQYLFVQGEEVIEELTRFRCVITRVDELGFCVMYSDGCFLDCKWEKASNYQKTGVVYPPFLKILETMQELELSDGGGENAKN